MDPPKGSLQASQHREQKGPSAQTHNREVACEGGFAPPMRHSPKPASWEEREDGGAVFPTIGLTTAGDPGPRSIKLSSLTSFSTCQNMRWQ